MFHLISPNLQGDLHSNADDLASLAALLAFAIQFPDIGTDADARTGASLLAGALASGIEDLVQIAKESAEKQEAAAYQRGVQDGRAAHAPRAEGLPELTEPQPAAARRKRAG